MLKRLSVFHVKLKEYQGFRITYANKGLARKQIEEMMSLRERLVGERGLLEPLITELTGKATIQTVGKGPEFSYNMWSAALDIRFTNRVAHALQVCIDTVNQALRKFESEIESGARDKQGNLVEKRQISSGKEKLIDIAKIPIQLFDAMQFHQKVIKASRALFENEHYAQAIFEAFKAVENFVQDKSDLTLYGTNLMEKVFNEENPIIKVPEAGHYYKDVQRGFKHLFIGAAQAIRNPKAHKEIIQKDPYITLEYLGFASFLLKRIDYWEAGIS
jgi:uncharacterized protein (TIGR02391 family)